MIYRRIRICISFHRPFAVSFWLRAAYRWCLGDDLNERRGIRRQAEHTYRVTVSAASDREREVNTALLSSLTPVLLRGVPMGERTLHPLELKTEGETLTFTVELCVPLPQPEKPGMEPPGRMATLNLDI